jgi:DNA-binding transcriptional LysR family regulator
VNPRALAPEPFILFPRHAAPGLYDQIALICRRAGFRPQVAQEAIQMQTIVSLVSAGLGVAIVPASIRRLHRERVVYRPLRPATTATEMAIAYHHGSRSMVLQSFLRVVAKISDR